MTDPEDAAGVIEGWRDRLVDVPLVMLEAAFRDLSRSCARSANSPTSVPFHLRSSAGSQP